MKHSNKMYKMYKMIGDIFYQYSSVRLDQYTEEPQDLRPYDV